MKSIRFVLFLATLLVICGCDQAKTRRNEDALCGTWTFTSVEGATKEQADMYLSVAQESSSALVLSTDRTYKFTLVGDVRRGNWMLKDGNVILTQSEKNNKPEVYSEPVQVVGEELILKGGSGKNREMSLVLSRAK